MDIQRPIRLLPTLSMLADFLERSGCRCDSHISDENRNYRGIRLYHGQELQEDVLYLLKPEEKNFPFDTHSYLSTVDLQGKANHLICPDHPDEALLDMILEIFSQFQSWEDAIDLLLYRNASLQELCELGARLLENPVCIHDDWFVMMAMTAEFARIMEPEYLMSSTKGFVPRAVVEDFQNDSDYLETYSHTGAKIWFQPEINQYSLYVNLWDGPVYKGRLLVGKKNRDFRPSDFLLAEALTQQAVMLLRRKQPGEGDIHQNMDDIVFALLQGKQTEQTDLLFLLNMLRWQKDDRFLCLRLKPQGSSGPIMEHLLHSDLFRIFPGSYILLGAREQCVILNLEQTKASMGDIRHNLAPLCRDYCLYAGISSPVAGILELQAAYYQAGAALDQAFQLRSDRWMLTFSECALNQLVKALPSPLLPKHLVAPELSSLAAFDREHGTPYFDTLRAYLLCERDIPKTAETLIIHRTTLLYRLKKIQTLVSLDLDDPWVRLYLILSLWIWKQQEERL